jgi:hypothetical protein
MIYVWKFICDLRNGCGAIIEIKSDRYDGHGYINCPVCSKNAQLKSKG